MHTIPRTRYRVPNYPTALEMRACPEILLRHVPKSWLANETVCKVLGIALAANGTLLGCNMGDLRSSEKYPNYYRDAQSSDAEEEVWIPNKNAKPENKVAPIFEHGFGSGSFGCSAVAPPVYLSEAEALEVIEAALLDANVGTFSRNVDHMDVNITRLGFRSSCDYKTVLLKGEETPLVSDLFQEETGLGIEYVSRDDYDLFARIIEENCSVTSYYLQRVARELRDQVEQTVDGVSFGVLYDPVSYPECETGECWGEGGKDEAKSLEQAKEESKEQLREQIRDLIAWFEAQGVI